MNRVWMTLAAASLAANACAGAAETAETMVPIKVQVLFRDKAQDGPQPFANVGGFVIRRLREDLKNASCPDASNEKGELTCRLKCLRDDPDLRLLVVAPLKAQAPIVAGMSPPAAAPLNIEKCAIRKDAAATQGPTVRLVYRTALAMAEELRAAAPEVFAAVADIKGDTLSFKPLKQTTPALQQLAQNPANRENIERLAEISSVYNEAVNSRKKTGLSPALADYASGAKSILLQASVKESMGSNADRLVTVSSNHADFERSVDRIAKALHEKKELSVTEITLARDINLLKQNKGERAAQKEKLYFDRRADGKMEKAIDLRR